MLKKYAKIVGSVDFNKFERKDELRGSEANCLEGYEVVFQDTKGNLFQMKNFSLSEKMPNGKIFRDGSRLLVKGWMNIIHVGDCYQLFPMLGTFGFCHGLNEKSSALYQTICNQQKLASKKDIKVSYLVDDEQNVIYEVREFLFDDMPENFDLFNGMKPIVLFKGKKEYGFIHRGLFAPATGIGSTKVHPIAAWWLSML